MIHLIEMYHRNKYRRGATRKDFSLGAQIKKGMTAWIILAVLEKRGELYGYGLRREAFNKSKGLLSIHEGPLYGLLKRMERKRWLASRHEKVAGRDRRYYRISARGRRVLDQYRREWRLLLSVLDSFGCRPA
jgi:PadR family transcriptional regulator, regulatory protein PadR